MSADSALTSAVFWVLALLAAASGFAVFRFNSMARVTIALLVSFFATGGLLVWLGLGYLGVVVVLMMTIEMIIMAVFMVAYMMNPAGLMPMAMYHNKRGSLAISLAVFGLLAAGIFLAPWPHPVRAETRPADPTFQLGSALMGPQMLTMVTLGFVLFATMVAATVLATHRGRYDRFGDDLGRRPPADPIPGGVGR
jgi:NADH:ubiquinone oxidoreductase subunit 6 (subunit J)